MKNDYLIFIKNVSICQLKCIYSEANILSVYSTLSGFKVMIQNVHVQFLFCNSIFRSYKKTTVIYTVGANGSSCSLNKDTEKADRKIY